MDGFSRKEIGTIYFIVNNYKSVGFRSACLRLSLPWTMDNVKFTFAFLTTANEKSTLIIALDGQCMCMNSLW